MQFHALALASDGITVDLIGEEGTPVPTRVLQHPRIRVSRLTPRRGWTGVIGSALALCLACRRLPRPDVIIAQTPPAIPTLVVTWVIARLRGSRLIIDWHNLGWTLLAVRFGADHPFVRVARWLERQSSSLADAHLAVSDALAHHVQTEWGLTHVRVLRDRPADAQSAPDAAVAMREQLIRSAGLAAHEQPAVVISPTSWTRDEALDLVMSAADCLEQMWSDDGPADGLVIVVSGEGSGRAAFEAQVRTRTPRRVRIVTTFVSADDYPSLVAAADAGLSLHRSSSGLDLPMKICDMFGAGLPVCALDYGPTLRELVTPDRNAVVFQDATELASCLDRWFCAWPQRSDAWQRLHAGAADVAAGPRWTDGWRREARALIVEAESV